MNISTFKMTVAMCVVSAAISGCFDQGEAERVARLEARLAALEQCLAAGNQSACAMVEVDTVTEAPTLGESVGLGFLGSSASSSGDFQWESNKVLSEGEGIIQGEIKAAGQPRSGVKLRLFLSRDLRTSWATSDTDGRYRIKVPPGKYLYQGYEIEMRTANRVLSGMIMNERGAGIDRGPHAVNVSAANPGTGPNFEFIAAVIPIAPLGNSVVSKDKLRFEWEPYPGAVLYELDLMDGGLTGVGRMSFIFGGYGGYGGGAGPSSRDTTIVLSAQEAALLKPRHHFTWHIKAYDKDHRELSRTPDGRSRFKLE